MSVTEDAADIAKAKMITLIAAAVAQRTPLPTVLLREMASTEASDQFAFSALSDNILIRSVTPLKIQGNSNASDVTEQRRQTMAPGK
jgi:hypothetical protein